MLSSAAAFYKATLSVTTGLSAPFSNLAIIYKQQVLTAADIFAIILYPVFSPAHLVNCSYSEDW